MEVALPLLFNVRNTPRTDDWNNEWQRYDKFVCYLSQRYPSVLVPHEHRGHHMLMDIAAQQNRRRDAPYVVEMRRSEEERPAKRRRGRPGKPKTKTKEPDVTFVDLPDLEELLPPEERRLLLLHMGRFDSPESREGHSVLLAFDGATKTQYVVDLSSHFQCGWYRALETRPLVPGYAVRVIGESPSYRHSPQNLFGQAVILKDDSGPVCGLLVVMCSLLTVLCGVSLPRAVRELQQWTWRASMDRRRDLICGCAGWYAGGASLPSTLESMAFFL